MNDLSVETTSWECPHCGRWATVSARDRSRFGYLYAQADDSAQFVFEFTTCPNKSCRKLQLTASRTAAAQDENLNWIRRGDEVNSWALIPESRAKTFPDYIPKAIRDDYKEAQLIVNLSPKASATLSRRALQTMIRDFWSVKEDTLYKEIQRIKSLVDAATWKAIDAVRTVGNVGAHMEKDINLVLDVEPNEAQLLICLIEQLLNEWYVARHEKAKAQDSIVALADQIRAKQKSQPAATSQADS